jgi:hypothetical protein
MKINIKFGTWDVKDHIGQVRSQQLQKKYQNIV